MPPTIQRWALPRFDPFLLKILAAVAVATVLPLRGDAVEPVHIANDLAIALLFFLHGARLSREAILAGLTAWRVHLAVLAATFLLFPFMGIGLRFVADLWLAPTIGAGLLLLCLMPSTVQSSIGFTAMARGNVPAAVCSAAASNLLGVVLTPLLIVLFFPQATGGISWNGVGKITSQLLVPFLLGHLCRQPLLGLLDRRKTLLAEYDRAVILLIVYVAFSAAVIEGLWRRYTPADLGWIFLMIAALLGLALLVTRIAARRLGFATADEIVLVFCGSKKSLASGVPIASALFPAAMVGPLILPLMLYHQLQLMVCAALAQAYARRPEGGSDKDLR